MFKKYSRAFASAVVPFLGSILIKLIYYTSKKTFHPPETIPTESCIVAFWHGDLLMQPLNYINWKDKPKIVVMISEHFDGELIAKTMTYFDFETIRGSTRSGAARVLMQAIKKMKEGYDLGITPDGPKGPRFSITDGMIAIAQKLDRPIVVQTCVPNKYWQLKSWDRFMIPKPFGHLEFFATDPISVTGLEMQEAKQLIHDKLMLKCIV